MDWKEIVLGCLILLIFLLIGLFFGLSVPQPAPDEFKDWNCSIVIDLNHQVEFYDINALVKEFTISMPCNQGDSFKILQATVKEMI
jgi:hypothetical protein